MSRAVLAIDPGNTESAWIRVVDDLPVAWTKAPNHDVLEVVAALAPVDLIAIEWPAGMGQTVGASTLDTSAWAGRFLQRWLDAGGASAALIRRAEVKTHLLPKGSPRRAKTTDARIRAAILDREIRLRGDIASTAGMTADVWQAYAVAITFNETIRPEGTR